MSFKIIGRISEIETSRNWDGNSRARKITEALRQRPLAEAKRDRFGPIARWYDMQAEIHWYEAHGIGVGEYKIKRVAVCIRNKDYPVSLELRKLYRVVADTEAAKHRQIRVVDESGEDYLYPEEYFVPVSLPQSTERRSPRHLVSTTELRYPAAPLTRQLGHNRFVHPATLAISLSAFSQDLI